MKTKLMIILFVVLAVLVIAAFLIVSRENESYSTSVGIKSVYHSSISGKVTKVVYDATGSEDLAVYRQDCLEHGGFFEDCGNICAPGATACVEVCGVTCTF